jgi:hypothetical protein
MSGDIPPPLLTSALDGCEWSSSRSYRFAHRETVPVPTDMRLGGPRSRCGRYGEEKNLLPLPGIEPRLLDHKTLTDAVDKYKKFCDILDIYFQT